MSKSDEIKPYVIQDYTAGFNKAIEISEEIMSKAKLLVIPEYQAKRIEDTLRVVSNVLGSQKRITCVDRDVMQAYETIKNVLSGNCDKPTSRF